MSVTVPAIAPTRFADLLPGLTAAVSFSVADILMASVLRQFDSSDFVKQRPTLRAYQDRCHARPAYKKALADHMASFVDAANPQNSPPVPFDPT